MVKITKTMSLKHKETQSPFVESFVKDATALPLHELPKKLATFPTRWPFPKGDLYHWVPLLNRFDTELEAFVAMYELNKGPQIRDFGCDLLEKGGAIREQLFDLGFSTDGDREVVEQILYFSRILLENCGNRSIYGSSPYLSDLLNSTSLSLLASTLQIGHQLAKRYQASFKRIGHHHRSVNATLLANHYNIDLDRVQQLCLPFSKTATTGESVVTPAPNTPATPKGKEKNYFSVPAPAPKTSTTTTYANDLASLVKSGSQGGKRPSSVSSPPTDTNWAEWGGVRLTYYETAPKEDKETVAAPTASDAPVSPTPVRRASTLGRINREPVAEVPHATPSRSVTVPMMLPETPKAKFPADEQPGSTLKVVEIPGSKVLETSTHELLTENLKMLPDTSKYTLLAKVRVAKALSSSLESRRQMLAVRLLAITNLAYIYSESTFAEKLMKQDSDEPRRLQLVYQLAELIHPPAEGEEGLPRSLQTIALNTIIGLAQQSTKSTDICNALQTNVNHGVLLYTVRMAVAEMAKEDTSDRQTEVDEWHSALFELLPVVILLPRAGAELVTAGLAAPMAEVLTMTTTVAERNYPNALRMLDNMIHQTREGFDAFAALDGMDIMSKLIIEEVKRGTELAAAGKGIPGEYRSASIDYEIPWYEQESLRWLFKLTHHMMNHGGTLGQNFERLLRNLMDSPELLASLRHIILNGKVFGSHAWTNAVGVLNDFINNEPTSFAVIAEAGLSRAVLESVMGTEIKVTQEAKPAAPAEDVSEAEPTAPAAEASSPHSTTDTEDFGILNIAAKDTRPHPPTQEILDAPRPRPLAANILPHAECMGIIPDAFGAICLSNSGMKMFLESNALESFMEIFESPAHIKIMESDGNLPHALGSAFDELMRHHPPLKPAIMNATLDMVARVAHFCKKETAEKKLGAKLMTRDANGKVVVADRGLLGAGTVTEANTDVDMADVDLGTVMHPTGITTPVEKSMQPMIAYISIVASFLGAMFTQKGPRDTFMEKGGLEYLLDLAALPIQPKTMPEERAHRNMQTTIASLADHKPHLVIPSLMKRTQAAADALLGFAQYNGSEAYFGAFVQDSKNSTSQASDVVLASGSSLAEALLTVTNLTGALYQCLSAPSFSARGTIGQSFAALNLGDYWVRLVKSLGPILAASAKEDFKLSKLVPRSWRRSARHPSIPVREGGVEHILPSEDTTRDALDQLLPATEASPSIAALTGNITREQIEAVKSVTLAPPTPLTPEEKQKPEYQNWSDLHALFSKIMPIIPKFLQSLGKVLIGKRAPEAYQRQTNTAIADAIAETVLFQFNNIGDERSSEVFTFWDFMLGVTKSILVNDAVNAERPGEIITFILMAFMRHDGFTTTNRILDVYGEEIRVNADKLVKPDDVELLLRNDLATLGVRNILDLYTPLSSGKHVADSTQSNGLMHRAPTLEKGHPDFYAAGQLVIETRMAILPAVKRIWDSEVLEKGSRIIPSRLITILRQIMFQDHETNVFKRNDPAIVKQKATKKKWRIDGDAMDKLTSKGVTDADLAKEALFRCNNDSAKALEYCNAQKLERSGGRNRVPYDEIEVIRASDTSTGTATPANAPPSAVSSRLGNDGDMDEADLERQRQVLALIGAINAEAGIAPPPALAPPGGEQTSFPEREQPPASGPQTLGEQKEYVTIEDLDEERTKMQEDLIDRCLEVISSHGNLTFEVSDLIFTVISKAKDSKDMRSQVGETLVGALASFMYSDDIRAAGKKVASYAHLLAILLQDKNFYQASLSELSNSLGSLLEFVKLSPDHKSEESSPWIAHILLIVEILLCNDAEPLETEWKIPTLETTVIDKPVLKQREAVVSTDHREKLFESILGILPRIGKDESLALAVLRILVILTRSRKLAIAMGEKKNIQRLFVMAKQLSGTNSTRVQSPLMVILRHIVEDDETIKQIMRAEIRTYLDPQPSRSSRHPDILTYLRNTSHLVDRNPELFVEVTNEMVKLKTWSSSAVASDSGRLQVDLQDKWKSSKVGKPEGTVTPAAKIAEGQSIEDVKQSTEEAGSEETLKTEHKPPVVENPDGVIHFLLSELMNYRDVEDMEVAASSAASEAPVFNATEAGAAGPSAAVEPASPATKVDGKKPKQEFKLEEHPIYLYRCFLLQCLTELLASYNRTKIEFIHFKRNAPTHAATPSKPRSDVVKYILFDLIPTGCLEHPETIAQRKRVTTSSWADSTLTALLSKTGEQILERSKDNSDSDDEPDLLFVRKFVLESTLKAYNQASASTEPLELKYSRMLSLADLMNHIMSGKDSLGGSDPNVLVTSQRQLKRIMFEKGFLGALTASIADIDLNFPGAKRAVKHILRPLKALTQTAIDLSELGKIAMTPGQQEEDEIESASSVSEVDEDREETPDLFRNSTLGMFEPDRENQSSSEGEDEDEEMYDEDGYEDEMEYDEGPMDDEEGPLSDEEDDDEEDEDIDGMGPIEGLDGDHNHEVEVIMDIGDEDEESGSSDEDDDEDMDDEDDDDDDNRVEIIDEHGNAHPLEALDDEDNDWESEEDEDEDDDDEEFHERLVEEEEQLRRGEDLGHGPLGRLIHSFADGPGGDVQGDIDNILQRLGDGTAGPMGILDEFMGDEHDHEHDDDEEDDEDEEEDDEMDEDDEDDMYQNYELAGEHAGMPFALEFDGGDGAPPVFVSRIGGRRVGGRLMDAPPFPFFPGGPRDPLGGMLDAGLQDDGQASPILLANEAIAAAHRRISALSRAPTPVPVSIWGGSWDPSGWTPGHRRGARIGEGAATPPHIRANEIPGYDYPYPRSHRHAGAVPRGGPDDGRNPLLQRGYTGPAVAPATPSPFMNRGQLFDLVSGRQMPPGAHLQTPHGILNEIFQQMPLPVGSLPPVRGEVHIHGVSGRGEPALREFQAMFGMRPPQARAAGERSQPSDPGAVSFFTPQQTITRWNEEARLLFGSKYIEAAAKVAMGVFATIGPAALEIHKGLVAKQKEATEKAKKEEEERKAKEAKAEEERLAKEKKEAEEKAEEERKKAEEEAAEAAANPPAPEEPSAQPMEGVEATGEGEAAAGDAPADNRPRITIPFRDGTLDITDLGIDLDYLDALPEEYREEVITGAIAQRRSEAAATGAPTSEIDQEFLDALPDEIRAEIMAQERQDRRRREREEARRAAAANGGVVPAPAEQDPAEFLNSLPPDMRAEAIALAAQDPEVAGAIPEEYLEQARALFPHLGRHVRAMEGARPGRSADGPPKPVRRTIVQMLDKAGIATLLRLMFIYQQESLRNTLHQVLQNISENRHNRGEVISTILHILQDGSADMTAVEKSFAHLSLRAKQPKEKEPKTPLSLSRKNTATSLTTVGNVANADISPLMVVQQCMSALIWLTKVNVHMPSFFLSEHEPSSGSLKRSLSKKGKGKGKDTSKEDRAAKFPLNSLLNLLDRNLIIESSPAMESLSFLLSELTKSLPALERRQKEAEEAAKKADEAAKKADEEKAAQPAVEKTEAEKTEAAAGGSPMDTDATAPAAGEGSAEASKPDEAEKPKEAEKKKPKPFVPPVVPDSNLKLLINIFVARECSAKTFRDTLSTIKNLSCLPEAKSVFGKELIIKAQELGQAILVDLEELLPQIQKASNSTELQGVALAKFSPSGSDQNKLLRVLTALDHLFTPKPKKDSDTDETEIDNEKRDLLASLYQNSTFGSMWDKLSACLTAIRQRENMLNVATILLPLIESLMVVCKNTDLKDPIAPKPTKHLALTSPVPESRMESLFYSFTEEHRKIMNDLVRNTPKLMSGTFSLLVKNPKVLEFDNKRNFFTRSVHNRNNPQRQQYPPLQLSIRRDQVFHDSFKSLYFKSGDEMKFGKLSIRFHGEEGIDAGGVTREWFQALSRQMFDPSYALFIPVSSDRTTFHPNLASSINEEHLMFFKFIGRVIGKALYEGRVLDCHFSRAVYKCILGKSVSVKDMESLDPDYYKSITWMLENDITDIITETFSVDNDKFGVVETVDLIENGRNIVVTEENKQEYVRLMVEFKLIGSVRSQLDNFLKGFHEIIPAELIAIFDEQELELLISGLPEIDVDDWKANTEYHQYTAASPQIQWFWRAIRSFDIEERAKMLQFVTGTSKVPLNGFKELEGMNGFSRFNIHRDYGNKDRLPTSHTCFNQYESYEMLRQQLLTAITTGADHFGFA